MSLYYDEDSPHRIHYMAEIVLRHLGERGFFPIEFYSEYRTYNHSSYKLLNNRKGR